MESDAEAENENDEEVGGNVNGDWEGTGDEANASGIGGRVWESANRWSGSPKILGAGGDDSRGSGWGCGGCCLFDFDLFMGGACDCASAVCGS